MPLENIIPDAENPLLRKLPTGKYTFANDSNKEVCAARYFAEEINEGRLTIDDAWVKYWSYSMYPINIKKQKINLRSLKFTSSIFLLSVSEMLNEDKFYDLLEQTTRAYFVCIGGQEGIWKPEQYNEWRYYKYLLCELSFAVHLLGRRMLKEKKPIITDICKELIYILSAKGIAGKMPSDPYGLNRDTYNIPFDKFSATQLLIELAKTNKDIVESQLIKEKRLFSPNNYVKYKVYTGDFGRDYLIRKVLHIQEEKPKADIYNNDSLRDLIVNMGSQKTLETLLSFLPNLTGSSSFFYIKYLTFFETIFRIIDRCQFNHQLVDLFNEHISQVESNEYTMLIYKVALKEYAYGYKSKHDLYKLFKGKLFLKTRKRKNKFTKLFKEVEDYIKKEFS